MSAEAHPAVSAAARTIHQWYGIEVPTYRLPLLASELAQLGGKAGLDAALDRLLCRDRAAWDSVISAVTIPETYLFRHFGHFVLLRQLAVRRRHEGRACRVLSAGCSTGEEAWSAAATLAQERSRVPVQDAVVGWDINERCLQHAREGRFRDWSARAGLHGYDAHFLRDGDAWRAAAHLRSMVRFTRVNLVGTLPSRDAPFDAVFFRNVGIYWNPKLAGEVVRLLGELVARDGLLLIGPSDPALTSPGPWEHVIEDGVRYYRRRGTAKEHRPKVAAAAPPQPRPLNNCTNVVSVASARRAARRALVARSAESSPSSERAPTVELVQELADKGEYERALSLVDGLPGRCMAERRLWRGILLLALERPAEAAHSFRQCVFLEPNHAPYRRWLAVAYESSGRMRDAEREHQNVRNLSVV